MSDDDIKKLQRALDGQPGIADLEAALDQQRRQLQADLEAMGMKPEESKDYGVCQLSEAEAVAACEKLNSIRGVTAHQKLGRIIINLDPALSASAQKEVNTMAENNKWSVHWSGVALKG